MKTEWHDGFEISVRTEGNSVIVSANKEGLLSLADILTSLAKEGSGHIHLDKFNSLEDDSAELIIEKVESKL